MQLDGKDNEMRSQFKKGLELETQVADLTGERKRCKPLNTTDKTLSDEIRTSLSLQKKASQQRILNQVNMRGNLVAERASPDIAFRECPADQNSNISRLQVSLESETRHFDDKTKKRKGLSIVKKGLNT